jgi:hypothetical protein
MTLRTLRVLLLMDIVSLIYVSAIHAGVLGGGPFQSASRYESFVAVLLWFGLASTWARPTIARGGPFVAQFGALAGVFMGLTMATRGMAPATTWDLAYQVVSIGLLVAGLIVALLMPAPEPNERRQPAGAYRRGRA